MTHLASTQAILAEMLRKGVPVANDPSAAIHAEQIAAGNDRLSPVEQVDIYREQFWLRHRDVLRDDFESLKYALGEDRFDDLAREYLAARPSTSYTLRDLGVEMIEFLRTRAPWSEDPFLVDLARVEWAFVDAFDGEDAPPFDPATITGVDESAWPGARLVLHPALQRLDVDYPAHDYRIAARKAETPERPSPRSCHVVIYRGPALLHCLEIQPDAAAMLDELAQGTTLEVACERAAVASNIELSAFQTKLAGWFSEWTSLGWIRAVVF